MIGFQYVNARNYFYFTPHYNDIVYNKGYALTPGTWDDDNGLGCGDFKTTTSNYYDSNFPSTCTSIQFSAQSTTGCTNMNLNMNPVGSVGCLFDAYNPLPNQICQITISCANPSWSSLTIIASSYAYLSGESSHVSYTASTIQDQFLAVNQIFQLDLSSVVTFSSPSTITSVTMYKFPTQNTVTTTLSGNFVSYSFNAAQSIAQYFFNITTNLGYAYSNNFGITVVDCGTPSITIANYASSFTKTGIVLSTPSSVFLASTYSTNANPSQCTLSYRLYDQLGNDLTTITSPQSFNTGTGELQIQSFTSGTYQQSVSIKVTATWNTNSQAQISAQSTIFQVYYSYINEVNCIPQSNLNGDILGSVSSLYTPYTAFTASNYFSTSSPCVLSYKFYDYPSGIDITNIISPFQFIQSNKQFQITSFTNNVFEYNLTIKVTSSYQLQNNSLTKNKILIRFVYCDLKYTGQTYFYQSIQHLLANYTLLIASQNAKTTNTQFCNIKYQIYEIIDNQGSKVSQNDQRYQYTYLDQNTGLFLITYFHMGIYQYTVNMMIDSQFGQFQNRTKLFILFNITVYSCNPIIYNQYIQQVYSLQINSKASINFPQKKIVNYPAFLTWVQQEKDCKLNFEIYYKNGTLCTLVNSNTAITNGIFIMHFTKSINTSQIYYFTATTKSLQSGYSNTQKSINFLVQVTVSYLMDGLIKYQTSKLPNYGTTKVLEYYEGSPCDIYNTKINADNFNPKFQIIYKNGKNQDLIQFEDFKISSSNCSIKSYQIIPSIQDKFLPNCFGSKIQYVDLTPQKNIKQVPINILQMNISQTYQFRVAAYAFQDLQSSDTNYQNIYLESSIELIQDCKEDKIFQQKLSPKKLSKLHQFYKENNENAFLYINISQKEKIQIDISQNFNNTYSLTCPLKFSIQQVIHNNRTLDIQDYNSSIELTKNGIFSIKQQKYNIFNHYLIYFQAINQQNISFNTSSYLVDASVYIQPSYSEWKRKVKNKRFDKNQICYGFIQSIDSNGNVIIKFNDIMNTNFNLSYINKTNTYIYIKPGNNRQLDEDFDSSTLDFTWTVTSFVKETMKIKLQFSQPLEISPLVQQDQLVINFNQTENLLYCVFKNQYLYDDYSTIIRNIRKQILSQNDSSDGLGSALAFFSSAPLWLQIVGILVVLIGYGDIDYLVVFIRTLQFIILLPGLQIVLPANISNYIQMIQKISSYDILTFFNLYALPGLSSIQFDKDALNPLTQQLQDVGYDNRNALLGLATFTFLIVVYFIKVFFAFALKLVQWILKDRYYTKEMYQYISKDLFFKQILSMTIEGFIDFCIFGYLNMVTVEFSLNGEILGLGFGVFSLSTSSFILPLSILTLILFKTAKQIEKNEFQELWGAFFEMIKVKNIASRIYYLVFYFRRVIYLTLCLYVSSSLNGINTISLSLLNLAYSIYIGYFKPFKNNRLNQQEKFNEFFVQFCTFFLIIFSDWVKPQMQKYFHGFVMIIVLLFYVLSNVLLIIYVTINKAVLVVQKLYNLFNQYFNFMEAKFKSTKRQTINEIQMVNENAFYDDENQIQIQEKAFNEQQERQRIFEKVMIFQIEQIQLQPTKKSTKQLKKINFQNEKISNVNLSAQSLAKADEDQNQQTVNYLLQLNQMPLETTEKMLQSQAFSKQAKDKSPTDQKQDKVYIEFLELYNKYQNLFERNKFQIQEKQYQKNDFIKEVEDFVLNSGDSREDLNFKCIDLVAVAKNNVRLMNEEDNPNDKIRQFTEELFYLVKKNFKFKPRIKKSNFMKILD